jgi:hypothetical protein
MPQSNILFESGAFEGSALTLAYVNAPYEPGVIGQRDLYQTEGIESTKASVEWLDDVLTLVAASPRGGMGDLHTSQKRKLIEFETCHIRTKATMHADSFQNVRGFGVTSLTSIEAERNRKLTEMRSRIGATIEYQWMRALAGQILDSDGSVLVDLLSEFGVSQNTYSVELDDTTTNVRNKIVAAKRLSEAVLGAAAPKSWVCYASASFIDQMTAHPSVEATMAGWLAARQMRDDVRHDFDFANVQFVEVRDFAGVTAVEADAAYLVPEGVPGLLITRFAPADYVDTVNTVGQAIYTRAEPLPFNRGVMIEAQVNPVSIVTRPRAIIKLTA